MALKEPLNILLVEDNRGDARLMEEMIRDTGESYQITWMKDGKKAIEFIDSMNEPDIIFLDLKVPKISGHEVLSYFQEKNIPSRIPIIIMTGSAYSDDIERSKRNGASEYLLKPMSIDEIDRMTLRLKEILGERRRRITEV